MSGKKANISLMILTIGIIALFSFAIFSFYISEDNIENNFEKMRLISGFNFMIDRQKFYNLLNSNYNGNFQQYFVFNGEDADSFEKFLNSANNPYEFGIISEGDQKYFFGNYSEEKGILFSKKTETLFIRYPIQ
jgi:hypothetical protein